VRIEANSVDEIEQLIPQLKALQAKASRKKSDG